MTFWTVVLAVITGWAAIMGLAIILFYALSWNFMRITKSKPQATYRDTDLTRASRPGDNL